MARINPILAIAAMVAGEMYGAPPTTHRFGSEGEFTVFRENGSWCLAARWLHTERSVTYKTRAQAFEAAADLARARGDSAEQCGKLLAGVRW